MTEFDVVITDASIREYEAEAQARRERHSRAALRGSPVRFEWVSPELNPDGSLTDEEQESAKKKIGDQDTAKLKQQWSGTQRGNSGSGASKKGWS
jgi:hypothetical protein